MGTEKIANFNKELEENNNKENLNNSDSKKENLATKIYDIAKDEAKFFKDERGEFYTVIKTDDGEKTCNLRSQMFNLWLQRLGLECNNGKIPYSEAINQAKKQLEAYTHFEGEEIELNNRVAELEGSFFYDLTNKKGQAIKISNEDWEVVNPPLIFRNSKHQKAQVNPAESEKGDLWKFLDFVNVKKEDQLLLIIAMVSAFIPEIPHVVIIIHGPQGSAKSTLLEFMREVIDPSKTPLLRTPRAEKDLVQVFDHHYCSFFDNLRQVKDWLSDAFCQAVTGAGVEFRTLFTDDEAFIRQYRRVIGLTGINVAATQSDLLDRSILVELEPIPKTERKEIKLIKSEFRKVLPEILSGVFNTIVKAKKIYPDVELEELNRMADFTKWGYAIGEALGGRGQEFLDDYIADERSRNLEVIEDNPLGQALLIFLDNKRNWTGTPGELLGSLEKIAEKEGIDTNSKLWPGNATWVTRRINEIRSYLINENINLSTSHDGRKRILHLDKKVKNSVNSVNSVYEREEPRHDKDNNTNTKYTLTNTKENSVKNSVSDKNAGMAGFTKGANTNNTNNTKKHSSLTKKNDLYEGEI